MKKFLSLALALVMTMSLVTISAGAKDFTDSSKVSYAEAVDVISAMEIVGGYADGSFNPAGTLTRGAASKIICNLLLGPTAADALGVTSAPFKDVPANHTFAGYIAYCSSQGIINGYSDGTFRPAGTVNGFAFLKMLLGALGYDGVIEKFTGTNWSVNVAKLAIDKGLTKGNDSFVGSKAMTREEAALYALNTLKGDLVQYDTKGTNITTSDGTVINVGASKAAPVISTNRNIAPNGYLQFGEKYFDKLKLSASGSDAFERPANTWNFKTTNIGTYAKTPDVSYTEEVKMGTIYSDLGLGTTVAADKVDFYEDGAKETSARAAFTLSKGNTTDKVGGNGVATEVYYDLDNDTATVVMVNTYAGEITGSYKATSSKDAYVTITPLNATVNGNFETTDFSVDDVVTYTYSNKTGDVGVKNVALAERVTGTLTGYTAAKSVTVGGTTYKFNSAASIDALKLGGAVKYDVTITLDANGYVLDVDTDKTSSNYAVVLNAGTSGFDKVARLLFTDGTTKDVVVADGSTTIEDPVTTNTHTEINKGDIVSYSVDNKDAYKLILLADMDDTNVHSASTVAQAIVTKGNSSLGQSGAGLKSNVSLANTSTTANGKTIFLIATKAGSETVYTAYVGIKNVPTVMTGIVDSDETPVTVYSKSTTSTGTAEVVFIDATAYGTVTSSTKEVVFVKGAATPNKSYDGVKGTYYIYDAIVNGEITKVEATNSNITTNTMFTTVSTDKNGIVSLGGPLSTLVNTLGGVATGTVKAANDVVGLGTNMFYSYDKDCKVFILDTDGNLSVSSIGGITTNVNNKVYFKITEGDVTTIVVEQPKDAVVTPPVSSDIVVVNSDKGNFYKDATFYVADGRTLTAADMRSALAAEMVKDGCSNIGWVADTLTYTQNNASNSTSSTTAVQVYKVTFATGEVDVSGVKFAILSADETYAEKGDTVTLTLSAEGTATTTSKTVTVTPAKVTGVPANGIASAASALTAGAVKADGTGTAVTTGMSAASGAAVATDASGGAVDMQYTITITVNNGNPCDTNVTLIVT